MSFWFLEKRTDLIKISFPMKFLIKYDFSSTYSSLTFLYHWNILSILSFLENDMVSQSCLFRHRKVFRLFIGSNHDIFMIHLYKRHIRFFNNYSSNFVGCLLHRQWITLNFKNIGRKIIKMEFYSLQTDENSFWILIRSR
jgi:hypothetical protein